MLRGPDGHVTMASMDRPAPATDAGPTPGSAPDAGPTTASPPATVGRLVAALRAAGCVFAEDEARMLLDSARTAEELDAMLDRRVRGVPLEQVVGWAEFCGLRVLVEPGVFVPRRRTELLVAEARRLLAGSAPGHPHPAVVVDLCCGSGALGAAVLDASEDVEVYAADVDPAAVACARRNLEPRGGHVLHGDLFDALPTALRGRVDVLVANAPYVPTDAIALMPPEARTHEHRVALDGGVDGLEVLRRVVAGAPAWLTAGGHLVVESSRRQAATLREVMERWAFEVRVIEDDDLDATAVVGTQPPAR
jgi:release factor glutamine methyltransferase